MSPALPDVPRLPATLRVLRLHQWAKNLLLFLPILAAHRLADRAALGRVALAFLSFGFVACAGYVLNDLFDLESDRQHPRKRARPFASGALSPRAGFVLAPLLVAAGATLAWFLSRPFEAALGGYLLVALLYSVRLKRELILDVLVLAGLYTVRIYAGAFAAGVPVSEWLASFSLFIFLSLALLKRASELGEPEAASPRRGYHVADRLLLVALGAASGYVAVLVLALYVNHPEVTRLYSRPQWLWGLCLLVLYWISRIWLLAFRGELEDDPVAFAILDPVSWIVAALGAVCIRLGT
ncbi:MAG TPA: UbiA family prenyltransferase [Anaeromyxobacteraceae bacterium]|nr:UbiA family prenyltransferase [Anaeromyxobacteraceae bacterium]